MSGGAYEVTDGPRAPAGLPGQAIVRETEDDLHEALGAELLLHAQNCVRAFHSFHLALSGGSTPMPFYRRLMTDPLYRSFPWDRTHLWIVDERRVPFDDERSNFHHISGYIVDHSDIPRDHVHPMHATHEQADVEYERELVAVLGQRGAGRDRLDFVLLGMGADGHTASLFPGSPAASERRRLVRINAGPTVTPPERVTMTFPLINAARFIAALVTGEGKRATLARVAAGGTAAARDPYEAARELPILGVRPMGPAGSGELRWYLDRAACG